MNTQLTTLAILAGIALPSLAIAGPIYSNDFQQPNTDPAAEWSSTLRRDLSGPYTAFLGRFGSTSIDFTLHATEANTADLPSSSGGNGESPYNISRKNVRFNRIRIPELDGGGGGGGGRPSKGPFDINGPKIDLGNAIKGSSEPPNTEPMFTVGQYALKFDLFIFDSWDSDYPGFGPDSFSVAINGEKRFDEYFDAHDLNNNFATPELPEQSAYNPNWQDQIYRDVTVLFDVSADTKRFDIEFVGSLTQVLNDESWGLDNVRIESVGQLRGASVPIIPAPGALSLMGVGMGIMARRRR